LTTYLHGIILHYLSLGVKCVFGSGIFRSNDDTKVPFISLFLKGETRTGNVFIPVKITGNTASVLVEKIDQWKVGDEILVEGELDWDGFEKKEKKQYATKINAFEV